MTFKSEIEIEAYLKPCDLSVGSSNSSGINWKYDMKVQTESLCHAYTPAEAFKKIEIASVNKFPRPLLIKWMNLITPDF